MPWNQRTKMARKAYFLMQTTRYRFASTLLNQFNLDKFEETELEPLRRPFSEAEFTHEMDKPFWNGRS